MCFLQIWGLACHLLTENILVIALLASSMPSLAAESASSSSSPLHIISSSTWSREDTACWRQGKPGVTRLMVDVELVMPWALALALTELSAFESCALMIVDMLFPELPLGLVEWLSKSGKIYPLSEGISQYPSSWQHSFFTVSSEEWRIGLYQSHDFVYDCIRLWELYEKLDKQISC